MDGIVSGGGHCSLGADGCLTGIGAVGSITGCESGDDGHDGEGESSMRGIGASMGSSTETSAGTHVDLLTSLSHLGNCASENLACIAVKRTLLGECMNRKLALLPGATSKYTISSNLGASLFAWTVNLRLLAMKHSVWCVPLKAGQDCLIVNMGGMGSSEFPPAIRQASHMAHSLSFVH